MQTVSPLSIRSFAKINLALSVLGPRSDGYHEIRTVYQSVDLHDELEIRPSTGLKLSCPGLEHLPRDENLVWKALDALYRENPAQAGADVTLKKRIPPGSGLGGGSANAAATLLGLTRLWNLSISQERLLTLAADLGSDVPFFLTGGTALGAGRGEEIYPLPELPTAHLVIIIPAVRISTAEAYRSLSLGLTSRRSAHKIQGFCGQLRKGTACLTGIFNDFETSILPANPEIGEARSFLIDRGATAALLSGSGSSVFGFFSDEESALAVSRQAVRGDWQVFPAKTLTSAEYLQGLFG